MASNFDHCPSVGCTLDLPIVSQQVAGCCMKTALKPWPTNQLTIVLSAQLRMASQLPPRIEWWTGWPFDTLVGTKDSDLTKNHRKLLAHTSPIAEIGGSMTLISSKSDQDWNFDHRHSSPTKYGGVIVAVLSIGCYIWLSTRVLPTIVCFCLKRACLFCWAHRVM